MTEALKPLRPLTTPHELRDATVRDYAEQQRRSGLAPDMSAIERQAIADLVLVDQYNAGLGARTKSSSTKKPRQRTGVEVKAKAAGHRVKMGAVSTSAKLLDQRAHKVSEKWSHATARLWRIVQGISATSDLRASVLTAQDPERAREVVEMWIHYLLRGRQSKWNPFAGLGEHDAARKFMAMTFDICDRSTAKLGPWWIK